jgi:hypothetical protein
MQPVAADSQQSLQIGDCRCQHHLMDTHKITKDAVVAVFLFGDG